MHLLQAIGDAIKEKRPFSVARVGDGENIVLAQYGILPEREILRTAVATQWPYHPAGIKLPDKKARDEVLASLKRIDLVGILPYNDKRIQAPEKYKRPLTEKVFHHYRFYPKATFDAYVFRGILSNPSFWRIMKGQRIAVISKWGELFKRSSLQASSHWDFQIAETIPVNNYYEISKVLAQLESLEFDVAFLGAGVGAIVLSQQIAERYGKVAIDIGQGISRVAKGAIRIPCSADLSKGSPARLPSPPLSPAERKGTARHWTLNSRITNHTSHNGNHYFIERNGHGNP
ncbi:GT-D fold domain-containing glycosyltransferase [Ammoniphilus sp. YIM 78166]|uniref:GT-D fold domain-containing glycosyltransferase n=1 Tax=Ammoniphilus sp. YIM 78166 TaxID=1644106 RepID=UPI0014313D9E|nr:GT-D fold domain-containing glycosyltransferase [Ammoniphilus sp. YIM 78166]